MGEPIPRDAQHPTPDPGGDVGEVPSRKRSSREYVHAMYRAIASSGEEFQSGVLVDDEFFWRDIHAALERAAESFVSQEVPLDIRCALPLYIGALEDVVADDFNECFQSHNLPPWNWNVYLFPVWLFGALFRYLVLFPLRVVIIGVSTTFFLIVSSLASVLIKEEQRVFATQRAMLRYLAKVWIACMGGVILYDGITPHPGANQIFVANHTTIIDLVVLTAATPLAVVGQQQPQPLAFFQFVVLKCLNCIWFDRKELKDRGAVRRRIKEHVENPDYAPLLIFPEGTCVNNRFTVQFKKGAFELDAEVCPVSLKYNNIFVDPFWDTRNVSFLRHLFNLLTAWALVCDVTFLPAQRRMPNETPEAFARRVQLLISETAGLKVTNFDGYLKHIRANDKLKARRKAEIARTITRALGVHKLRQGYSLDAKTPN